jgi:NADP-dependent aldehyde dehydrogenase
MKTQNIIGFQLSAAGTQTVSSSNPKTLTELEGAFSVATTDEIELAMQKANTAWKTYRHFSGAQKGEFLRAIAEEIEALGDTLIDRMMLESGLSAGRCKGERGRTMNQLKLFASLVEEGSWIEATIDHKPMDLRRMLLPLGAVVVFTASNFPLAFSTAGGDTASALAAGCPVIVKAHESHLGTNALVSEAIQKAAQRTGMPDGVFSSLNGSGYDLGQRLVEHPFTKAVAFTGSNRGGMALYRLAQNRKEPIPVFAEMGSTNPVFLLPNKVKTETVDLAAQLASSVNLGAGQFCTNPGLLVALDNEDIESFETALKGSFAILKPHTMLNQGIFKNYENNKNAALNENGVTLALSQNEDEHISAKPAVATVSAQNFIQNPKLHEEIFGPFTMLIKCQSEDEMQAVANALHGQLSATVMSADGEHNNFTGLINTLQEKVGRLVFNGVPTGVAVVNSMQHGGPFPATTDSRFTSVGTSAIKRFARPITFQDYPADLLPDALKENNPLGIWRTVDGEFRK